MSDTINRGGKQFQADDLASDQMYLDYEGDIWLDTGNGWTYITDEGKPSIIDSWDQPPWILGPFTELSESARDLILKAI